VKNHEEFDNFDRAIRELLKVPHSVIKEKLDEEKAAKKKTKRTKVKRNDT
jgi:hypothetical protein